MGVSIRLDVLPERIAPDAWAQFYEQARRLWTQWPDPLVTLRRESVGGIGRQVFSRAIEQDADDPSRRRLGICGDLASMRTAEVFALHADLTHYRRDTSAALQPDILAVRLAGRGATPVFAEKTQGHPYHQAVLAVAVLAETRFPGGALVSGDITAAQCELAARTVEHVLGERLVRPILIDADRLYARVVAAQPELAVLRACDRAFLGPRADTVRLFRRRVPREPVLDWLAAELGEASGGRLTLGVIWLFQAWLNGDGDLDDLIEAAALRPDGPRLSPALLAEALVGAGVSLSSERIDGLSVLDRPAEVPPSVDALLGNALLDVAGLSARHGRCRLGMDGLSDRLQRHFPAQAETCREIITSRTAVLEEQLGDLGAWATGSAQRSKEDVELGDGESFIRRKSGDPLSTSQGSYLQELANTLRIQWDFLRVGLSARLGDSAEQRRRMILRVADLRGLVLTEAGWGWIDDETDLALLDLLMLLLANEESDALLVNLRRALFEHRDLSTRVLAMILSPTGGTGSAD